MSIVTKRGDGGSTRLGSGKLVSKDHIAIECCGELDELGSCLGLAKSVMTNAKTRGLIESVQRDLFAICSEAAAGPGRAVRLRDRIGKSRVDAIEKSIAAVEKKCPSGERRFTTAGRNRASGAMDLARTVARRAERRVVTLKKKKLLKNKYIMIYLNRLSDLLYLLARCLEKEG
jgi:cob(I)alamin adenosyltransferase